jgi:hypothetical protein
VCPRCPVAARPCLLVVGRGRSYRLLAVVAVRPCLRSALGEPGALEEPEEPEAPGEPEALGEPEAPGALEEPEEPEAPSVISEVARL